MYTMNLFEAKTHLSQVVADVAAGRKERVAIARRGKPEVWIVPMREDVSKRIGIARGKFLVPDNFDKTNRRVGKMFASGKL